MDKPVRKAVRTIIIQNDNVLAIKYLTKKNNGFYDIPGGQIETGETNLTASMRECLEETGIEIIKQKYIGNLIIEYPNMIFNIDVIICSNFKGKPGVFTENEVMWIKIEELIKKEKKLPCIEILKKQHKNYIKREDFHIKFIVDKFHNIKKILY